MRNAAEQLKRPIEAPPFLAALLCLEEAEGAVS
jgi:hypothetical protein